MDIDKLSKELMQLPDDIKHEEAKILAIQEVMENLDYDMKGIELKTNSAIFEEKTDGKLVFSNEKLRDAELYKRLKVHTGYIDLLMKRKDQAKKLGTAKIELAYAVNRFKSLRQVSTLIGVKYRVI